MGAFQLQFLDRIPAHAAIDESVELTKKSGHRFASGMVNAVLRRLAATRPAGKLPEESAGEIALAYAHPAWLVERWTRFYGLEAARAICRYGQTQPPRIVRFAHAGAESAEEAELIESELVGAGVRLEPGAILTAARAVVSGRRVTATAAYHREGRARLQDEGSQLIAELAAYTAENSGSKIETILDACAAPGGKTLIFAERNPHAHILACESSQRRLAEMTTRLARRKHSARVECRLADANCARRRISFSILCLPTSLAAAPETLGRNPGKSAIA